MPANVELVETSVGTGDGGVDTCALTMASDDPLARVVTSWRRSLDESDWEYAVQQSGERSTFLQLESPQCGLVMVFAPGSARVAAAVPSERTPTLVSLLPCGVLPEPEPAPPG